MRIAVLHWHTSSVGGINTTLQILRDEALARGDTLHILASDPQKSKRPGVLAARKRVRGGDTFITIDGYAPHHPENVAATLAFLLEGYDVVLTSFLCPHPTKAYGDEPLFLPLFRGLAEGGMPIVGYIHDAYFDTYREWAELVFPFIRRTMVCQHAYAAPLIEAGYPVTAAYTPFREFVDQPQVERDPRLVAWTPQWKNIKGIRKFFHGIPSAAALGYRAELYGNGIEYYKMRLEPSWKETVGRDNFAGAYSGTGSAEFFGCVHEREIAGILSRASFMADFQGSGKPRYKAYTAGSYNHTVIEALYYGCVPIVHSNMLKSGIPAEFLLAIDEPEKWPEAVAAYDLAAYDRAGARRYVIENHSASGLFDRIFGGLVP